MSDRLAADKDFQEFSCSINNLVGKIQLSKTGSFFQKYFQHTISDVELSKLLTGLDFTSKEEFSLFLKKILLLKAKVNSKFPEIVNDDSKKAAIEAAARKVILNLVKPNHTTGDCWVAWLAALSACSQYCAMQEVYTYDSCMWECTGIVSGPAGLCFLMAD